MRTKLVTILGGAALVVAAATVQVVAHHSFAAEFDAKRPVKLRGTVTKMEWINPHSWIHIDVTGPDGKVEKWMVEGFQAKDGSNRANGRDITFPDGKKLFVGSSGTGAPDERPGQ